jgi:hypothetical protein
MERRTLVILAGVVLLVFGCFLPLFQAKDEDWDDSEKSTYWDLSPNNKTPADGPAIYLLGLAGIALLMIPTRQSDSTWLPGLLMLTLVIVHFYGFWGLLYDNDEIGLGLGLPILALGAILVICAPLIPLETILYPEVAPDPYLLDEQP